MTLDALKKYTFLYMAGPYSLYPAGIEQAFIDHCRIAAELVRDGVHVYSPVAHTHPIAVHGDIEPLNHEFWMKFNRAAMKVSKALVIVELPGWEESVGVEQERLAFARMGKPIYYLDPDSLELTSA